MSKAGKEPGSAPPGGADLPFEEALRRLEGIVEGMENEDLPLEKLLSHYEEGVRLAQSCQSKLADAEVKVQQLEKSASGEHALKPMANILEAED